MSDETRKRKGFAEAKERAGGLCEAQVSPTCQGRAECVHHRLPLAASSPRNVHRHEPDRLLVCCHNCHRWIHAHPAEAYESGHLLRRGAA